MKNRAITYRLLRTSVLGVGVARAVFSLAGCARSDDDLDSSTHDLSTGSQTIVVSQVYPGPAAAADGGTADAGADPRAVAEGAYIELFNRGSASAKLGGQVIGFLDAKLGKQGIPLPADLEIPAHAYYLIGIGNVPASDATTARDFAQGTSAFVLSLPFGAVGLLPDPTNQTKFTDVVGYGALATPPNAETKSTTPLQLGKALSRKGNGCTDTDDNSADFEFVAPHPRNSHSAPLDCSGGSTNSADASADSSTGTTNNGDASTGTKGDASTGTTNNGDASTGTTNNGDASTGTTTTQPDASTIVVQGPKGDPGAKGDPGVKGDPGMAGIAGEAGAPGAGGAAGPAGGKGDNGADGHEGPAGGQGDPGDPGALGAQGKAGPAGKAGSNCSTAPVGSTGGTPFGAFAGLGLAFSAFVSRRRRGR